MLNPKGFAWVGLFAADFHGLVSFYETKLGLRIIEKSSTFCIFDAGNGCLFEIWGKGSASLPRKSAHQQSMLIGFLVERLEPAVELLRGLGLEADTEISSHLGSRWIYYTDPEGNRFELKDTHAVVQREDDRLVV